MKSFLGAHGPTSSTPHSLREGTGKPYDFRVDYKGLGFSRFRRLRFRDKGSTVFINTPVNKSIAESL